MPREFIYTCTQCGKSYDLTKYRNVQNSLSKTMREDGLCQDCAFWKQMEASRDERLIIIQGIAYASLSPMEKFRRKHREKPYRKFLVRLADHTAFTCDWLTKRAAIPECRRKDFPDQYCFISREAALKINGFDVGVCRAKGCFDRYHCFFYNSGIVEPDGPWNIVPEEYTVGSEKCPSFINKHQLINGNC